MTFGRALTPDTSAAPQGADPVVAMRRREALGPPSQDASFAEAHKKKQLLGAADKQIDVKQQPTTS